MAKLNAHIHAFNAGEISKAGLARVDQQRARIAAETQENILPHVVGKGLFRPGFKYINNVFGNDVCELIPFAKSVDDTALLVLRDAELRIMIDDTYLQRESVTSTVTNGDFSSATGWTLTTSGGATADIDSTVADSLYMACTARGGLAICERSVTTSTTGTEHGLRIVVTRGPVSFRCGSTSGDDDLVPETVLDTGTHSLAFTPSASPYYVRFLTKRSVGVIVDSIEVEASGHVSFTAPWAEAEMKAISYAQSLDEVFLAHTNWRTRRVQRNNNTRSWSLVEYRTEDGPFQLSAYSDVKLTPGATTGNTTLTADRAFFKSSHVGCLFRLFHDQTSWSFTLGAADEHTEAIRVNGVGDDNTYSLAITGTWTGTITRQRSYTSAKEAFVNTTGAASTYTANTSANISPGSNWDNVVHWYRYQMTSYTSGTATVTLTYTGDAGAGVCRITAVNSSTSADIEILAPMRKTTATADWREGAWSDRTGWPSAVAFTDGRLALARDDKFWLSESDGYYSFSLDTEGDKATIQRAIATGGGASTIKWLLPLQRLLAGTTDQVASIRSSALNEELTPTSTTVKDAATVGVAPVRPARIDSRGMFLDRSLRKVYELNLGSQVETGDYAVAEVTDLNEDIGGTAEITSLVVQRQPETYVWHTRADGQAPVLLYEPKQQVAAYVRIISDGADGEIETICTLPSTSQDRVYAVIKRTINGSTVRYIEKMALHSEAIGGTWNKMADCYTTKNGPTTSITCVQLANETGLIAWATDGDGNGVALTGLSANGSGVVALGGTYTNICCGLPYTGKYKSSKLAYGAQGGTALLQTKQVGRVGLLLANTHREGLQYGQSFDDLWPMPPVEQQAEVTESLYSVYDEPTFAFDGSWDTDSRVCIQLTAPYPATLLGLVVNVDTNENV